MAIKRSIGERVFDVLNTIFMIFMIVICLAPMLHVFFASFSEPEQLMRHTGIILKPLGFTLKGYELVFKNPNILSGYYNTIIYVVFGTALNIIMTSLGAYALSRKDVLWNKPIMLMITFTMFFSGGLIPFYLLVKNLGWIDSRLAVIVPGAINVWNLIVMRTSFASIPDSLCESAQIDGANDFVILFRIILPVSKATLAAMTLFYAVGHWNSWFNAMIFLKKRTKYPLQLILREILITEDVSKMTYEMAVSDQGTYKLLIQYATIVVSTLPILFIYPFLQKYFVQGVMVGSLKG